MTLVTQDAETNSATSETESQQPEPSQAGKKKRWNAARMLVKLFSVFCKLFAVAVIVAMITTVFERAFDLLDPLVQFRLQMAWVLLVLAAVFFVLKSKKWAVLSLVVALPTLVSAAAFFLPWSQATDASVKTPTRRVLFFNLLHRNQEIDLVLDLIKREDPDLICFVEYVGWRKEKFATLDARYPHMGIDPNFWGLGGRVYSKFPLVQETDKEKAPQVSRVPVVRAEISFPERTISLFVSHPCSPTSTRRIRARNRQLDEYAELIKAESQPVICCGDFNCTTWSAHLNDFIRDTGLTDTRRGFGLQASWPAYAHAFPVRIPIDHIFVSDDILVVDRRLGEYAGSDHLPVIVDFKIKPQD